MTALKVSIGFGEGCLWLEREGAGGAYFTRWAEETGKTAGLG